MQCSAFDMVAKIFFVIWKLILNLRSLHNFATSPVPFRRKETTVFNSSPSATSSIMSSSSMLRGLRVVPSFHKTSTGTSYSPYLWPSSTRTPPSTFAQNKFNSCSSSSRSISKFDKTDSQNTTSPTPTPPFQCSSTRTAFSAFYVNAKSPSFSTRTSFAQIGADETRKKYRDTTSKFLQLDRVQPPSTAEFSWSSTSSSRPCGADFPYTRSTTLTTSIEELQEHQGLALYTGYSQRLLLRDLHQREFRRSSTLTSSPRILDNYVHHVIHDRELFWSFIDAVNYLVYTANTVSALVQAKTRLPESEKGLH